VTLARYRHNPWGWSLKIETCRSIIKYWCRIHLRFRLMGGLQAKSMTSQRTPSRHKMADMCYYGNVFFYVF